MLVVVILILLDRAGVIRLPYKRDVTVNIDQVCGCDVCPAGGAR